MCRMVAALSARPLALHHALVLAPRSLRVLSTEHCHGWGVAVHADARWSVTHGTPAAHEDPRFDRACAQQSHAMIAHVRLATVGSVQPENTHPFLRGRWCFAHNGTIRDLDYLSREVSSTRDGERLGSTDSERFLSYLLTRLDHSDLSHRAADERTDRVLLDAVREATDREDFGALNFVLSDGATLYVHRMGRTMSMHHASDAFTIASEPWSEAPHWSLVTERSLIRVDLRQDGTVHARELR